ncbi:MAG: tetratricopeptide repeat protein [Ignavibacteria bacterium]|nr:tetratricopeptide repeat protein [Ignavibacteria bacterium]
MAENKDQIKCPVCGTVNPGSATYCNDCGALLNPEKKKMAQKNQKEQGASKGKNAGKGTSSSETKTAGIVLGILLLAGMFILIGSGVFESPKAVDPHAGHNHPPGEGHDQPANPIGKNPALDPQIMNLEKQLAESPDNLDVMLNLAHSYFDSGMFEKAVPLYKKYLEKKPNIPDVIVDLGVCYFNMQDLKQAEESFKKALTIDPKHQIAHLNMGVVSLSNNNKDEATKWLTKTIELDPNSNPAKQAQSILEKNK